MSKTTWPTNYASVETAPAYRCGTCGMRGVKLWREYSMFLSHQTLECVDCALASQKKEGSVGEDGFRDCGDGMRTDQIGWRIPAVPTEEGDTFWGYSSVPQAGVAWWRRLPLRISTAGKGQ